MKYEPWHIRYVGLELAKKLTEEDRTLEEYIIMCNEEWSTVDKTLEELKQYVKEKSNKILNEDKVISILGLIINEELVGFISLFKYDGEKRKDLTPWYATMCVKKGYRGKGYSRILNDALINEAKNRGYKKIYLKSELKNYYEKFGAIFMENIDDKEKLYYIDLES